MVLQCRTTGTWYPVACSIPFESIKTSDILYFLKYSCYSRSRIGSEGGKAHSRISYSRPHSFLARGRQIALLENCPMLRKNHQGGEYCRNHARLCSCVRIRSTSSRLLLLCFWYRLLSSRRKHSDENTEKHLLTYQGPHSFSLLSDKL